MCHIEQVFLFASGCFVSILRSRDRVGFEADLVAVRLALNEHLCRRRGNVQLALELACLLVLRHLRVADRLDLAVLTEGHLHRHVVVGGVVVEGPLVLVVVDNAEQQPVAVVLEALHDGVAGVSGLAVLVADLGHDEEGGLRGKYSFERERRGKKKNESRKMENLE